MNGLGHAFLIHKIIIESEINLETNHKPLYLRHTLTPMPILQPIQPDSLSDDPHWIHIRHFCSKQAHQLLHSLHSHTLSLFTPNIQPPRQPQQVHLERNYPHEALHLYKRFLVNDNAFPDNYTYPILLRSCAVRLSAFEGNEIHCHVVKLGFGTDVYARNTLMNLYAVCGNMVNALKVFDESPVLDLVSWNTILAGYVQMGDVKEAECLYGRMPERNTIASNSMIVLFGRMGCVVGARQVFDEIQRKDMISWSAMVSCYEQNDVYEEALVLFVDMNGNGVMVDEVVVVSAISACTNLSIVKTGMSMHALAVKIGIEGYVSLQNALIHLYSSCGKIMDARKLFSDGFLLDQISWNSMISGYLRCGSIEDAETLFYSLPDKDAVYWSAMISGYAQHERFSEALALFQEMQLHGIRPDVTALVSVISACTHLAALDLGRWVHAYISKNKL